MHDLQPNTKVLIPNPVLSARLTTRPSGQEKTVINQTIISPSFVATIFCHCERSKAIQKENTQTRMILVVNDMNH